MASFLSVPGRNHSVSSKTSFHLERGSRGIGDFGRGLTAVPQPRAWRVSLRRAKAVSCGTAKSALAYTHAAPLELLLARLGARHACGGRVGGARVVDGGHLRRHEPRALHDGVDLAPHARAAGVGQRGLGLGVDEGALVRARLSGQGQVRVRARVSSRWEWGGSGLGFGGWRMEGVIFTSYGPCCVSPLYATTR